MGILTLIENWYVGLWDNNVHADRGDSPNLRHKFWHRGILFKKIKKSKMDIQQ